MQDFLSLTAKSKPLSLLGIQKNLEKKITVAEREMKNLSCMQRIKAFSVPNVCITFHTGILLKDKVLLILLNLYFKCYFNMMLCL